MTEGVRLPAPPPKKPTKVNEQKSPQKNRLRRCEFREGQKKLPNKANDRGKTKGHQNLNGVSLKAKAEFWIQRRGVMGSHIAL